MSKVRKSKSKGKKVKSKSKGKKVKVRVNENEFTAKKDAKGVLSNRELYQVYCKLLILTKRASSDAQKIIKGNKVIFRGERAETTLSANRKEVRLYYRSGMKKAYREKAPNDGTIVFSHSGDLFTPKVELSLGEYLTAIFRKYKEKKSMSQQWMEKKAYEMRVKESKSTEKMVKEPWKIDMEGEEGKEADEDDEE